MNAVILEIPKWGRGGGGGVTVIRRNGKIQRRNARSLIKADFMELHFLNGIFERRHPTRACVKSILRTQSSGCLGFKSIIVPYSPTSPSNAIDFLRPPCENYLAEFTLFRGKAS